MKYYKWTAADCGVYARDFKYDKTGAWMTASGKLEACVRGFHACQRSQVPLWCGTELWEVEVAGDSVVSQNKSCHKQMRFVRQLKWTRADAVAFAAWCTKRAAHAAKGTFYPAVAGGAAKAAAFAAHCANTAADDAACAADATCAVLTSCLNLDDTTYPAEMEKRLEWIENRIGEKLE